MATAKPVKSSQSQAELLNRSRVQAVETRLLISRIRARRYRLCHNSLDPSFVDSEICSPANSNGSQNSPVLSERKHA